MAHYCLQTWPSLMSKCQHQFKELTFRACIAQRLETDVIILHLKKRNKSSFCVLTHPALKRSPSTPTCFRFRCCLMLVVLLCWASSRLQTTLFHLLYKVKWSQTLEDFGRLVWSNASLDLLLLHFFAASILLWIHTPTTIEFSLPLPNFIVLRCLRQCLRVIFF